MKEEKPKKKDKEPKPDIPTGEAESLVGKI